MNHLILVLESPLMAFGGETIDNLGFIRWFPSASMLTGLLANALGWRRVERERHQRLQDRLVFAARIDREPADGIRITDFQTARLGANDQGWTSRGIPERRAGGVNTYDAPHLRYRDYFANMRVTVALRLDAEGEFPTLEDLAQALREPARPLFIGRKPCLPSIPLFGGFNEGNNALAALLATPIEGTDVEPDSHMRLLWPQNDAPADLASLAVRLSQEQMLTDQRNWLSGLHGGGRAMCYGTAMSESFGLPAGTEEEGRE